MKAICIDNKEGENYLTVGKEYDVIEHNQYGSHYSVMNDEGWHSLYSKLDFKPVQETVPFTELENTEKLNAPVKSDGKSSSYYDLEITRKDGSVVTCTAQDIISSVLNDNFALGNIFKAIVRVAGKMKGGGKAGTSLEYDMNKVSWFAQDFAERNK